MLLKMLSVAIEPVIAVLILIVLEHALKGQRWRSLVTLMRTVLILIVLEHALKAFYGKSINRKEIAVLILIVLEHALKDFDFNV